MLGAATTVLCHNPVMQVVSEALLHGCCPSLLRPTQSTTVRESCC